MKPSFLYRSASFSLRGFLVISLIGSFSLATAPIVQAQLNLDEYGFVVKSKKTDEEKAQEKLEKELEKQAKELEKQLDKQAKDAEKDLKKQAKAAGKKVKKPKKKVKVDKVIAEDDSSSELILGLIVQDAVEDGESSAPAEAQAKYQDYAQRLAKVLGQLTPAEQQLVFSGGY